MDHQIEKYKRKRQNLGCKDETLKGMEFYCRQENGESGNKMKYK